MEHLPMRYKNELAQIGRETHSNDDGTERSNKGGAYNQNWKKKIIWAGSEIS